ncbi:hypothetical protein [Actinomadura spongiicola]|uniref:hypothetical protein n=1 Tax=Actinomadura spongiicola TaxID=2303421 RepID=UPI001314130C|nr:hypothetical protein [Actinomadura spongiicola]
MSDQHQAGGFDERAAERLLDGAGGDVRLRALLTAAAAPARPGELAGEDAAVAAFLAAPRPARRSRAAALRRFLTIKALAVVGGSLILTGGAAFATITGQLPGGGRDTAPSPSPTINKREGTRGDATPATRLEPPAPVPTESRKPSPTHSTKRNGRDGAPGQQKKTKGPKLRPTRLPQSPPRGPGDNGKPPDAGTGHTTTSGGGLGGAPGGGMGGGAVGGGTGGGEGTDPPTTSGSGNQD